MSPLNREEILRKALSQRRNIFVEELGDEIIIRQLSADDVLKLSERQEKGELSLQDYTYELVVASVVDEEGNKIFDNKIVREINIPVMTVLINAISEFNGLEVKLIEAQNNLKKVRSKKS